MQVNAAGKASRVEGEFRPEKRWRIFAGFKIHNDIGFTDLQPNVQELDNRNTDGVLDIISRYPFYKFNFETTWLVDNYFHPRGLATAAILLAWPAALAGRWWWFLGVAVAAPFQVRNGSPAVTLSRTRVLGSSYCT